LQVAGDRSHSGAHRDPRSLAGGLGQNVGHPRSQRGPLVAVARRRPAAPARGCAPPGCVDVTPDDPDLGQRVHGDQGGSSGWGGDGAEVEADSGHHATMTLTGDRRQDDRLVPLGEGEERPGQRRRVRSLGLKPTIADPRTGGVTGAGVCGPPFQVVEVVHPTA